MKSDPEDHTPMRKPIMLEPLPDLYQPGALEAARAAARAAVQPTAATAARPRLSAAIDRVRAAAERSGDVA